MFYQGPSYPYLGNYSDAESNINPGMSQEDSDGIPNPSVHATRGCCHPDVMDGGTHKQGSIPPIKMFG